ncbi:hypothetical protein D1159_11045 [Pseudoflavonifractor sp. 524-17]|uniref:hypothetical protein n=1 Tax=Pseudoflavonifractor sp. 524-17 TaxID=2304577 RepID=UPI0013796E77|nr:hypothetical protein [Pseudoflavonifractor sp. 524-17]NCE65096.1 hypothetical protein [Pseudoflavonifractor sp. 524-17]
MDRFLAMKEHGETILFSELLAELPSDDVLRVLFPPQKKTWKQLATRRGLEVLKLHLNGLHQPEIADRLGLTPGQAAYAFVEIKNCLYKRIPPYIDVDIPPLRKILGLEPQKRAGYSEETAEEKQDLGVAKGPKGFLCQTWDQQIFVDEHGMIRVKELENQLQSDYEPLMDMFYSAGYKLVVDYVAFDLALSFVGQSIANFEAELRRRAAKSAAERKKRSEKQKKWADHVDDMSNIVIGIESIDLFETGFHIWLLLNTQYPYQQQRAYVQERHKDIVCFINHELQSAWRRVWQKVAALIPFSELVSVTVTRQNTVQYTYELKEGIQEILKRDTNEDGC